MKKLGKEPKPSTKYRRLSDLQIPKIADLRPSDTLLRRFFEANAANLFNQFYDDIHTRCNNAKSHPPLERHKNMLEGFLGKYDQSFGRWQQYLEAIGTIPDYPGAVMDLLHLGMWDSSYSNDHEGNLSPFGPWLSQLGDAMGGDAIGILHGLEQQMCHQQKENLSKAQTLANELYDHFLDFLAMHNITSLKPDYEHPPIIQLYAGGAVTWLKDLAVPTIIAINQAKAVKFSGFSALPHEFGHDLSGTFSGVRLVAEIIEHIGNLQVPHREFWQSWVEECFADAIGVATIKEAEIFSLANLFSDFYTNIIFQDESAEGPDEHPNRHIRVLLAIEVGRILGIDSALLDQTKQEWMAFGQRKNSAISPELIYDQFNNRIYPMNEFIEGIQPIANALVDNEYQQLNGKKVRQMFEDFDSALAKEMREVVTEKKWVE